MTVKRSELWHQRHHRGKMNKGRECFIQNNICQIPMPNNVVAICDEDRFTEVNKYNWCFDGKGYPKSNVGNRFICLHKFLYPEFKMVDHINGNKLDNRACNLRECVQSQNMFNSKRKKSPSGFRGVFHEKRTNKFFAAIRFMNHRIHLGTFLTAEEAARAYDKKAIELHKEFATLNFGGTQ